MIPSDLVDLSRLQFALTAMYHFIFVPLTLGLSFMLVVMELAYVISGKQMYKDMTRFWQAFGHQLRHRCGYWPHDGISVRHELGLLLPLCG